VIGSTFLVRARPNLDVNWATLLAIACLVPVVLLSLIAAGSGTLSGDSLLARWLQDAPVPFAEHLAALGNFLGEAAVGAPIAVLATIALAWLRFFLTAAIVVLATALRLINEPLKSLFDSPRPTADVVRVTEVAQHHGFPSGHAMGSVLLYGSLAFVATRHVQNAMVRRAALLAASAIIILVGFGRVYVGAHWPSDVLGGYLWGLLLLLLVVRLVTVVGNQLARRPFPEESETGLQSPGSDGY
jgi:undecaprenyl-diphosphatase